MACNSKPFGVGIYCKEDRIFWSFLKCKDQNCVASRKEEQAVWNNLKKYFHEEYRAELVDKPEDIHGRGIGPFVCATSFDLTFITEALYNALCNADEGTASVNWCLGNDHLGRLDTMERVR